MRRRPIGQILVEKNEISEADLQAALAEQERSGRNPAERVRQGVRMARDWIGKAREAEPLVEPRSHAPEPLG